jgi:hypothetical protein
MTGTGPLTPLDAALAYRAAGLSVIPVAGDGSKAPDGRLLPRVWDEAGRREKPTWDPFKERLPTEAEVRGWFGRRPPPGVAIIGGEVSRGLLVLDFEFLDFFEEWRALVEIQAPGLAARLPTVRTPGKEEAGGRHVHARSAGPPVKTAKLARITRAEAARRTGDPGKTTAVEVKAEGGYVLAPGCPAECHETGRLYRHVSGPPVEQVPTLAEAEVNLLLACARALERGDKASADRHAEAPAGDGGRPGDDFNRRADWLADVLPDGWKVVRRRGEVVYLCRPGKDAGVSATVGYCRSERAGPKLYVFSTNAEPFEAERSYSKFEAYAQLHHGGDFKAAARELGRLGYGDPPRHAAGAAHPGGEAPGGGAVPLGPLTLRPGPPRQTAAGKIVLPLGVFRGGVLIDQLPLSSAASGRRDAARILVFHAEGAATRQEAEAALAQVVAAAARELARGAAPPGPLLRAVVRGRVLPAFRFGARTRHGLWAEAGGCEVARQELLAFTPGDLLDAAALAADVPPQLGRQALLKLAEAELRILWADLRRTLPAAAAADLSGGSAAAERFGAALVRLWNAPKVNHRVKDGAEVLVFTGSLVSRVTERVRQADKAAGRPRWLAVHPPYKAWWRRDPDGAGEVRTWLAMRYELADQFGMELPGVTRQEDLTALLGKYQLLEAAPAVPARLSGADGGDYLAVLALDFTERLLQDPEGWSEGEVPVSEKGGPH